MLLIVQSLLFIGAQVGAGAGKKGPAPQHCVEEKEKMLNAFATLVKGKLRNKSKKINEFFQVRRVGGVLLKIC